MTHPSALRFAARTRLSLPLMLAIVSFMAAGCAVRKTVEVPKPLTPLVDASTPQLIAEVNRLSTVRSIHGKVDIQFEDTSFAAAGIAEKYRTADGTITLQRPGKIYLVIQVPLLASDVAQMTSDGEHFRIAILKGNEQYRRFVRGTNGAIYPKLESTVTDNQKSKPDKEAQTVSALSNLRPQHLTDAMLIRPIMPHADSGFLYSRSEFFQEEKDPNPGSKKRVVRGYYLLEEVQPAGEGSARLLRRFWFDRVGGIRLARIQTFDEQGALVTDVSYGDVKSFGEQDGVRLPSRIELTRPRDQYKVSVTYQSPASATLDREYPPEAFVLENRWQLKEVDLDAQKKSLNHN
jgi:hypothetical protein